MSANSKIEWTDHTFNPWIGCTKVSPACDHCYAEVSTPSRTLGVTWGAGQERRRTSVANWAMPLRWNAQAEAFHAQHGRRQRVFCASLGDWLDNEVPIEWFIDQIDLIRRTVNFDWLLLSKRIGNFGKRMAEALDSFTQADRPELHRFITSWLSGEDIPTHVWLGTTICNQDEADRDIPKLLRVLAAKRFLSIEPLLGPVDLEKAKAVRSMCATCRAGQSRSCILSQPGPFVDWVIVGGESGHQARPTHPDWARSLRDQCTAAGVPFLFKQWGEWLPINQQDEAFTNRLYRSNRAAKPHEDQGALDDCFGRRCTVNYTVVHSDGSTHSIHEPNAFLQGTEAMQTFKVGKKTAGRLLDGVQHDGYPTT